MIGPFLIILRVANQTALTSDIIATGMVSSICFKSREELVNDHRTLPDEDPASSIEIYEEIPSELGAGVGNVFKRTSL